jgi:plasmid stabilization system protein ParE
MIAWHPKARAEFVEAIDYLLAKASLRIARDFATSVQETLRLIEQHPLIGTRLSHHARRLTVHGFTYSLIYREHGNDLQIVALAHQRRRPGYWAQRR